MTNLHLGGLFLVAVFVGCDGKEVDSDDGDGGSGGTGGSGACSSFSADDCEANDCKLYEAYRVDTELSCFEPEWEPKGCGQPGCTASQTTATDPDGVEWYFKDGCHPAGWESDGNTSGLYVCDGQGGGGAGGTN